MKTYSCLVRLQGEVRDQVRKSEVTAAEIRVLKVVHGDDAVVEVKDAGEALDAEGNERTQAQERARLEMRYGPEAVAAVFGAVKQVEIADEIEIDDEIADEPLPVVSRKRAAPADLESLTQ